MPYIRNSDDNQDLKSSIRRSSDSYSSAPTRSYSYAEQKDCAAMSKAERKKVANKFKAEEPFHTNGLKIYNFFSILMLLSLIAILVSVFCCFPYLKSSDGPPKAFYVVLVFFLAFIISAIGLGKSKMGLYKSLKYFERWLRRNNYVNVDYLFTFPRQKDQLKYDSIVLND